MENNAQTNANNATPTATASTVDYEAEYRKVLAERDALRTEAEKQKGLKDQYAKENAEYKRKAEAQMSDEEKKAKEWQDLLAEKDKAISELAQMRLEKEGLANGFNAAETEKLIKGNFAFKDIAEIVKSRVDEAVKSANAEFTKGSAAGSLLGKGTASDSGEKSDFQKRQESRQKQSNIVEL